MLKDMPKRKTNLSFVSLFSGCGGLDLGFEQAGFICAAAYDIDPLVVKVHKTNLNSPAAILNLARQTIEVGDRASIDVVVAGPPCQGFSTAGKRRIDDPRNHLLLTAGRIAINLAPKVFLVENVRGVISGAHNKYWVELTRMLRDSGYRTRALLLDMQDFGVAQLRKRMVLIAWKKNEDLVFPSITRRTVTLWDVLQGVDGAPNHSPHELDPLSDIGRIAKHIKPGQKLSNVRGGPRSVHTWDIPKVFGHTTDQERKVLVAIMRLRRRIRLRQYGDADPVSVSDLSKEIGERCDKTVKSLVAKGHIRRIGYRYDLAHSFNGKFRRLRWEEPSTTVDTRFIDPRYFLHPDDNRGFTVREAARIQGFPDTFIFTGTEKDQCRMIGNAVPPPMAHRLAVFIRDAIIGNG